MCAWDATKPPASGYLQSAEVRSNWAAIQDQVMGKNLLGDPDFLIWATGTCSIPSWWNGTGITDSTSSNIERYATGTTSIPLLGGKAACKITYLTSEATIYQNVLSTSDTGDNATGGPKKLLNGQAASAAAWIYTDSADCKLMINGPASDVLSTSTVTTGSWQYIKRTITLESSTMTRLGMGVKLGASGDVYVGSPSLVLGPIAPDYFVPAEMKTGTIGTVIPGDPVAVSTDYNGAWTYTNKLPFIVDKIDIHGLNAVSSGTNILRIDTGHYNGTSYLSLYSQTTNTPKLVANTTAAHTASLTGAYRTRCFAADPDGTAPADSMLSLNVTEKADAGGKNPVVKIRATTYNPPLQHWRANGQYK